MMTIKPTVVFLMRDILIYNVHCIPRSLLTGKHPVIRYRVFLLRDYNANIIARLVNIL